MKQDEIGALASFDVVLKVGGVEVELGGQSLVYTWEGIEMLAPIIEVDVMVQSHVTPAGLQIELACDRD